MPKPMETEKFMLLCDRDFENGAVRDGLYEALKERDGLRSELGGKIDDADEVIYQLQEETKRQRTTVQEFDWWVTDVQYKAPEQLDGWRRGFIHTMNPDARKAREDKVNRAIKETKNEQ